MDPIELLSKQELIDLTGDHWDRLLAAETAEEVEREGYTGAVCPLCQAYAKGTRDCGGCPVKKKTRLDNCNGSPWSRASLTLHEFVHGRVSKAEKDVDVKLEVEFIRSLKTQP